MNPDDHYSKTLELLDKAHTATVSADVTRALRFLIEAVDASTRGWMALDAADPSEPPPPVLSVALPSPRALMIQGKNCVSALNEYAQRIGRENPSYTFEGSGPFSCTCHFLGHTVDSEDEHRTKNEAKHDAAMVMLEMLREGDR